MYPGKQVIRQFCLSTLMVRHPPENSTSNFEELRTESALVHQYQFDASIAGQFAEGISLGMRAKDSTINSKERGQFAGNLGLI